MITFESSLPATDNWWVLTKIYKLNVFLEKIVSSNDIKRAVCLECIKPKTFEVNEYQNTAKYKDLPNICKTYIQDNGDENLFIFNRNKFNQINDLLILNPIYINSLTIIPQPPDSFYIKKPTGRKHIYGIYEYSEYRWERACPAIYKTQDTTGFNNYPSDANPISCPSERLRLRTRKPIPGLPYCEYVAFSCVCDNTQVLNRPLDRFGNPIFCHNNNYILDPVVLPPNGSCTRLAYKCNNISAGCKDAKGCNNQTFAGVNVYGTLISYNNNVPETARCPAGYYAESCENNIAICKPCEIKNSSTPTPCKQDDLKCLGKCPLGEYGKYIGNDECVCEKCTNTFDIPQTLLNRSFNYKILNFGKNISNPCYVRTLGQKSFSSIPLIYSEDDLYHILIDGRQIACVDNNTICNLGIPSDLSYPLQNRFSSFVPGASYQPIFDSHKSMISNYIASLINLINENYFDNLNIENCEKCILFKSYILSLNNFLHDIIYNYSLEVSNVRDHFLNIFENYPTDSKLGYYLNNNVYNPGDNNLFIKLVYTPRKYLIRDKISFEMKLYLGNQEADICSVC